MAAVATAGDASLLATNLVLAGCFLLFTWAMSRLFKEMRLPPVIGSLFAGMVCGPQLLDIVPLANDADPTVDPWRVLGNFGVSLYIFEFGITLRLEKMRAVAGRSLSMALLAVGLPALAGLGVTLLAFGTEYLYDGIAAGLALAPTSPLAVKMLDEESLLRTWTGQVAMTAIILVMILSLMLQVLMVAIADGGRDGMVSVVLKLFISLAFLLIGGVLAKLVFPRLTSLLKRIPRVGKVVIQPRDEAHLLVMLSILMAFAYLTSRSLIGSHLLGTFVAGMCFADVGRSSLLWRVQVKRVRTWCVRLFFAATIGFTIPVRSMFAPQHLGRGVLLGAFGAVGPKLIAGLPARPPQDAIGSSLHSIGRRPSRSGSERQDGSGPRGWLEPSQLVVGSLLCSRGEFAFFMVEQARTIAIGHQRAANRSAATGALNQTASNQTLLTASDDEQSHALMREDVWICVIWALLIGMCVG